MHEPQSRARRCAPGRPAALLASAVATLGLASAQIGTPYCVANANSTGSPSVISAAGSADVTLNNLTLACAGLPLNAFGFFISSRDQAYVLNPGGSAGNLCIGGQIGRYSLNILNSGTTGQVSLMIDLTAIPHPILPFSLQPGDTLNFQYWHRDAGTSGATSNFSPGLEVTFTGPPPTPSWANDIYPMLDTINSLGVACTTCHGGTCNLDLSSPQLAYTAFVGQTANCCAPATYIVPGDANGSLVYQKLVGTQSCGSQMPLIGDFPGDVTRVQAWIDAGAPNN